MEGNLCWNCKHIATCRPIFRPTCCCGCFFGTIAEFESKVNETHADNAQYRKEYLEAIKYVKAVM